MRAEQNESDRLPLVAHELNLPRDLGAIHRTIDADAGDDAAPQLVLVRPPVQERGKTLRALLDRPVELRREVVDPPALQPQF